MHKKRRWPTLLLPFMLCFLLPCRNQCTRARWHTITSRHYCALPTNFLDFRSRRGCYRTVLAVTDRSKCYTLHRTNLQIQARHLQERWFRLRFWRFLRGCARAKRGQGLILYGTLAEIFADLLIAKSALREG